MAQRVRGQGSVRHRDGRWEARLQLGGQRHTRSFDRETDAWAWIATLKSDSVRGILKIEEAPAAPEPVTFGSLARMLKLSKDKRWREGMGRFVMGHCKSTLFRAFEHTPVHELTAERLQRWLDSQIGRPALDSNRKPTGRALSLGTVKKYEQVLRQVLSYGVKIKRLARSPMDDVERTPKAADRPHRIFKVAELRALLQAIDGRDRAFFAVLAFAGLRKGEAFRMRWKWVDFDARMIRVLEAKRDSSEVPMSNYVAAALKAIAHGAPDDLVFPGWRRAAQAAEPNRKKMLTDMRRPLARGLKAARVDPAGITLHSFRRTFLSLLERVPGVTTSMVRDLARHTRQSMGVTGLYLISELDELHGALAGLEARVFPPANVIELKVEAAG